MTRFRLIGAALLVWAAAGFGSAQDMAAPTVKDYRFRVVQPPSGATITGTRIHVTVDTEIPAEADVKHTIDSTPHPDVDVFLDGIFQGKIRGDENVIDMESVPLGKHAIVLLARNQAGEIIDRHELEVTTVAPRVAAARPIPPAPVPPPPAPVAAPQPPPPAPAPVVAEIPKTATADPLLVVAGLALLLGGLAIRRFA
jgi:hypothetical protein